MRKIMVLNSKGGCGKSTIATNLASYYAAYENKKVTLVDFDPQGSSLDWLKVRSRKFPEITGINATKEAVRFSKDTEIVIMDVPARVEGRVQVDQVDRLVGDVLAQDAQVVAVVEQVRVHRARQAASWHRWDRRVSWWITR